MKKNAQFKYLDRWVDKATFRTFVYNDKEQKLADSYEEYEALIASGLWFDQKPSVSAKARKPKHGADS